MESQPLDYLLRNGWALFAFVDDAGTFRLGLIEREPIAAALAWRSDDVEAEGWGIAEWSGTDAKGEIGAEHIARLVTEVSEVAIIAFGPGEE